MAKRRMPRRKPPGASFHDFRNDAVRSAIGVRRARIVARIAASGTSAAKVSSMTKSATLRLIEAAERLNMTGVIGHGAVANFHELATLARLELHPVDALKDVAERSGFEIDPAFEARARAICDEPVPVGFLCPHDKAWETVSTEPSRPGRWCGACGAKRA